MSRRQARGFFRQELVGVGTWPLLTIFHSSLYLPIMTDLPPDCECVLLFDGVCHLCDGAVRFVVAHDHAGRIHFAPIQGELGRQLYLRHGLDPDAPDSMLLVTRERAFRESDAVIEIGRRLGGAWKLAVLGKIIPRALRDAGYALVARNRYRWFGKNETCLMPTQELRRRMLA